MILIFERGEGEYGDYMNIIDKVFDINTDKSAEVLEKEFYDYVNRLYEAHPQVQQWKKDNVKITDSKRSKIYIALYKEINFQKYLEKHYTLTELKYTIHSY